MQSRSDKGISISALLIASVSSAGAAVVVHALWAPGTLPAAALMPVLVELFAEALRRPTRWIAAWAPRPTGPAVPAGPRAAMHLYRVRPRWLRATALGLLAFVIAAAALTGGEALLQRSLGSAREHTTLLGGERPQPPVTTQPPTVVTVTVPVPTSRPLERGARRGHTGREPAPDRGPADRPAEDQRRTGPPAPVIPPTSTTTAPSDSPPAPMTRSEPSEVPGG